jgi:hypothetical protein
MARYELFDAELDVDPPPLRSCPKLSRTQAKCTCGVGARHMLLDRHTTNLKSFVTSVFICKFCSVMVLLASIVITAFPPT